MPNQASLQEGDIYPANLFAPGASDTFFSVVVDIKCNVSDM